MRLFYVHVMSNSYVPLGLSRLMSSGKALETAFEELGVQYLFRHVRCIRGKDSSYGDKQTLISDFIKECKAKD
jgi:hypothetical protein